MISWWCMGHTIRRRGVRVIGRRRVGAVGGRTRGLQRQSKELVEEGRRKRGTGRGRKGVAGRQVFLAAWVSEVPLQEQ